jgi:hypothetical protein
MWLRSSHDPYALKTSNSKGRVETTMPFSIFEKMSRNFMYFDEMLLSRKISQTSSKHFHTRKNHQTLSVFAENFRENNKFFAKRVSFSSCLAYLLQPHTIFAKTFWGQIFRESFRQSKYSREILMLSKYLKIGLFVSYVACNFSLFVINWRKRQLLC